MRPAKSFKWYIWGVLVLFCIQGSMAEFQNKMHWPIPFHISYVISKIPSDLLPTLNPPRFFPEPLYTWGESNTVYWPADSIESSCQEKGWTLLFYDVQARYEGNTLWGYVDAGVDSATFIELPEGIFIEYRLRYYAKNLNGEYAVSDWSSPVFSIQDFRPPTLVTFQIEGLQNAKRADWVVGENVNLYFMACDSMSGKIKKIILREKSETQDIFLEIPVEEVGLFPAVCVEFLYPYTFSTRERETVWLLASAVDISGQESVPDTIQVFWWPPEDRGMVCFPNPCNPTQENPVVIKVDETSIQEVRIYDPFGQLVRVLHKKNASDAFFEWDGKNGRNEPVSSGGYLCILSNRPKVYCKIAVVR